jgi:hypothetical protein
MNRIAISLLFLFGVLLVDAEAQPRFKGKRLDTSQAVLANDSTLEKLIQFKDSLESVGPAAEGPRPGKKSDSTGTILLVVGLAGLVVWAGRRAWLRRRK